MKRSKVYLAIFSIILVFSWLLPDGMLAQDVNQVALIIRHSDQSVQTACVEFAEPEINGLELLQRSGFDMEIDVQGLGAAVCSIEQTGCPPDDCWCQCKGGGDCVYWSYWLQLNDQWQYSQGGATTYNVGDGAVQGWSWGPGAVNAAISPPAVSFADVCTSSAVEVATATPTSTAVVFVPDDTPTSAAAQSQPANTETATPMPTSTIPATATFAATSTAAAISSFTPTVTATAVPMATEQTSGVTVVLEPLAGATATIAEPVTVVERDLVPAATLQILPSPSPASNEAPQPATEAAAAVAMVEASRPGERDVKKLVEVTAEAKPNLTVVGAAVQAPDLQAAQPASESHIAEIEDGSSSPISYAIFSLIVLGLVGLLLLSSVRRLGRENSYGE